MNEFTSVWLLPILFIFHDMEELVLVPRWLKKNDPNLGKFKLFGGIDRSDILSIGIWEELIIYLIISIIGVISNYYVIVVGASIPFLMHLIMHIGFCFRKKKYVPGAATSIVGIPLLIFYIYRLSQKIHEPIYMWIIVIVLMFVLFGANIRFIHFEMNKMNERL